MCKVNLKILIILKTIWWGENMETIVKEIEKLKGVTVLLNENMSQHTNFKIGGKAKVYCEVLNEKSLIKLLKLINLNEIEYHILGNATNVLFSDKDFDGIVVKLGGKLVKTKICGKKVYASAGNSLMELNKLCASKGLMGLELTYGIPASVGGAVRMNAGAFKVNVADNIEYVRFFNGKKVVKLKKDKLGFGYRTSLFASHPEYVILSCCFKLLKGDKDTIVKNMNDVLKKRLASQPYDKASAGSVFKRNENFIVSKCIDELGLKGYKIGGAEVSTKHAGFIINNGKATCKDVINLIQYVQEKVYENYGFVPELEVELMGDFDDFIR